MTPRIGSSVHYVSYGTPGGEYPSVCRAAIVTEVDPGELNRIGLTAINPTGMFFHSLADGGCRYHDGAEQPGDPRCTQAEYHGNPRRYCPCGWAEARLVGGTWHWPEAD